MKRILVCEDEDAIREFVVINLRRAGYNVTDVANGEDALKVFDENKNTNDRFDVVLLDVMMPGIDGFQVCKKLREKNPILGIIMLTAKSQEIDKVNGLMLGADDYISKPFSPSELTARVDSIHRRVVMAIDAENNKDDHIIKSGPFTLNTKSRMVYKNGGNIDLTQVEFQIMAYFMQNPGTAMDRKTILKYIWGDNYVGDDKIIDVNVRRIRMKIEDNSSEPRYIATVWGYGYKWTILN